MISSFSTWQQLGIDIISDASGSYAFSAFAPQTDSTILIAGSFKNGNSVKCYNIRTKQIHDVFLLPSAPFDIYAENSTIYVLLRKSILLYDTDSGTESTITIPSGIRTIERLFIADNKIFVLGANGNSFQIEGNTKQSTGWVQEDGKYVFINRFINKKLSEKDVTLSIRGNDLSNEESMRYTLPYNLGAVLHIGNSAKHIIVTAEEIVSEYPLKTKKHLIAFNTEPELQENIGFDEELPNVYYTYIKTPLKIKNGELHFISLAPEGLYYFSSDIDRAIKDGGFHFGKFIQTKEYHYNDHTGQ